MNTFDLEFEVDPLFKKTSAAFDEGGVEGLLLNQLCIRYRHVCVFVLSIYPGSDLHDCYQ